MGTAKVVHLDTRHPLDKLMQELLDPGQKPPFSFAEMEREEMKKRPRDPAQLAKLVVDIATGEVEDDHQPALTPAQEFARQGGLKGGLARAEKLSSQRRSAIAKKAAVTRWKKKQPAD